MCPGWYIYLKVLWVHSPETYPITLWISAINIPILHSIASISHYNFAKFHDFNWKLCLYLYTLFVWDWTFHVLSCLHGFLPSVFHFMNSYNYQFWGKFIFFFFWFVIMVYKVGFFFFFWCVVWLQFSLQIFLT